MPRNVHLFTGVKQKVTSPPPPPPPPPPPGGLVVTLGVTREPPGQHSGILGGGGFFEMFKVVIHDGTFFFETAEDFLRVFKRNPF